jgi:translation initiation factor 2 subunit 2
LLSIYSPDDQIGEDEQGEGIVLGGVTQYPWEGTDRDYKYDEVIDTSFLFNISLSYY